MHLTNYSINKRSANFKENTDENDDGEGHKRNLGFVFRHLEENGFDPISVKKKIYDLIVKTVATVQPSVSHIYHSCQGDDVENQMCFEILGFDVMLDHKAKPWLIEINQQPSFATDSPLDFKIKKGVIADALILLNLNWKRRLRV